jgi:hypothetical protein
VDGRRRRPRPKLPVLAPRFPSSVTTSRSPHARQRHRASPCTRLPVLTLLPSSPPSPPSSQGEHPSSSLNTASKGIDRACM